MGGPVGGERCLRVHARPITCPRPSGRRSRAYTCSLHARRLRAPSGSVSERGRPRAGGAGAGFATPRGFK